MEQFYTKVAAWAEKEPLVLATIVKGKPELLGGKSVYRQNGHMVEGTNADFWQKAAPYLVEVKKPSLIQVEDSVIFAEILGGTPRLIICGGGHVSLPVAQIGKMLGFEVTIIDDRQSFANTQRFPMADQVLCQDFTEALASVPESSGNYFVIVTRGHQYDQICLRQVMGKAHAYIGMIGSKNRVALVKKAMIAEGFAEDFVNSIHSPIGLKIGAETPEEISISIFAEIIAEKNKGSQAGKIPKEIIKALQEETFADMPKTMVTITRRQGSAPRDAGTKMLVLADGTCIDTIGGGCVEAEVRRQALTALDTGKPRYLKVDITGKNAAEDGMVCGGIVELFLDPVTLRKEEK